MDNYIDYVIQSKNLKIRLLEKETLLDYGDMNIPYGKTVLIEGPNGAGKSTLLNVLFRQGENGYWKKEDGGLLICGKKVDSYRKDELRRSITFVNQQERFMTNSSVYDYLVKPALAAISNSKNKSILEKEIKDLAYQYYRDYLYSFIREKRRGTDAKVKRYNEKIENYRRNPGKDLLFRYFKKASTLSGGQAKMLHLLSAAIKIKVTKSKLLLMDEPLNNLDKDNKVRLLKIIEDLRVSNPRLTILLITHCRVFPNIQDRIELKVENHSSIATYQSFEHPLPEFPCLK